MKTFSFTKKKTYLSMAAVITLLLSGCDSNISFTATREDLKKVLTLQANLTPTATGASIVKIANLKLVPDEIKKAETIEVLLDNSENPISVTRNQDGTLSFPTLSTTKIDSDGNLKVFFVVDKKKSFMTVLKTGPVLKLNNPGVLVTPNTGTVIRGEKVYLKANAPEGSTDKFIFNWFYGTSSSGPFLPISGTFDSVDWTPPSVGNYYVKLDTLDKETGASSSYVSPVSVIFVTDAKNIIGLNPNSGTVLRGKQIALSANLPNIDQTKFDFTWSYSSSAQAGFVPIFGNTQTVNWTTNSSGSFYIKVDVLNKETNQTSTYSTNEPIVFVTENENIIKTEPISGNISRGSSIKLDANVPISGDNNKFSWAYASSPQGPWLSVPGSSKSVDLTPSISGSYYVKIDVTNGDTNNVSTFISPKPIVFVTESSDIFAVTPAGGAIKRGNFVDLAANIPGASGKSYQYNWSYGTSLSVPFQPMNNLSGDIQRNIIKWRPPAEGSFFVKVDAVNLENKSVVSFTSTNPMVFVNEITPLFKVDGKSFVRAQSETAIEIEADVPVDQSSLAWSYGTSTVGPWTAIGGSSTNRITWKVSQPRKTGSYYIKMDLIDNKDGSIASFVSRAPIVFIDSDTTATDSITFGTSN
ncbi:MAG: hypothetical protein ACK4IX_01350 [Candidatus Sericytochromatia bacterium]